MRIKLIKIFEGAIYQSEVWDYWLLIQLKNEQIIKIFDDKCFASSLAEGEFYNFELSPSIFINKFDIDLMPVIGDIIFHNGVKYFRNNHLELRLKDCDEIMEIKDSFFGVGRIDLLSVEP